MSSDSYVVIARRHRPQKFTDLVGQETLINVLKSGLKSGKIGHAFVLTGIQGVGKTTIARLLAKSLNCLNLDIEDCEPCGECLSCVNFSQDKHVDIIEIDAASRTGVDDIREIIESVQYRPLISKYKIFIIDEVHMLSKGAFNALLKTLEEPPAHVKFIFATTELQKIPATILSRCLKFELKSLSPDVLKPYYLNLLNKDDVQIEDDALDLICTMAKGSARDGCSILEQAIALKQGVITLEQVQRMLGFSDQKWLENIFDCFLTGKPDEGVRLLEEIKKQGGADPKILMSNLLDICYGKMIISLKNKDLKFSNLARAWQILQQTTNEMTYSPMIFESLEVGLMKISFLNSCGNIQDLLKGFNAAQKVGDVIAVDDKKTEEDWKNDPTVQALLQEFPGANIEVIDI